METIRVVLTGLPQMLDEIIRQILASAPDIVVTDTPEETDVIVTAGDDRQLSAAERRLLQARPRVRLIIVGGSGRQSSLWAMRPQQTPLGELSASVLLAAIRGSEEALP